jgi:membrane-bound serine protease (ClpP class)
MTSVQLFAILLTVGVLFVGAEIFVPGGILGALGAVALVGAVVVGYSAFPGYGTIIAIGVGVAMATSLALWVRFFPRTPVGKAMTVAVDLSAAKASGPEFAELAGREGEALSDLRPGGYARINGRRVDVLTQGEMISAGARVRVVKVEGNRVVVAEVKQEEMHT